MKAITSKNSTINSELITEVLAGNQIAISTFYYQVIGLIKSIIRKASYSLCADDIDNISHDIFVDKIYFKIEKFNSEKYMSIIPYIHSIVKYHLIDLYRKKKTEKCTSLDEMIENNSHDFFGVNSHSKNTPENMLIKKENIMELSVMLDRLNEKDRRLIIGFYLEEKSLKELVTEYDLKSQNAVSIRLFRSKLTLKKLYQSAKDFPAINY